MQIFGMTFSYSPLESAFDFADAEPCKARPVQVEGLGTSASFSAKSARRTAFRRRNTITMSASAVTRFTAYLIDISPLLEVGARLSGVELLV